MLMKRMLYALLLAALQIAWAIVPASAQETVLMPRWGKETVSVTDEIVFYDYKGTDYSVRELGNPAAAEKTTFSIFNSLFK